MASKKTSIYTYATLLVALGDSGEVHGGHWCGLSEQGDGETAPVWEKR